ncbi:MAG: single-stranded-DNA-specific exonuclease RecJ [Acidobacteriota bacterium]
MPAVNNGTNEWRLLEVDGAAVQRIVEPCGIPDWLGRLLVLRGITDPEEAERFLHPSLEDLHDPLLMKGMERALGRLQRAIAGGEEILVYGDYDVDGITATVLLRRALEMLGGRVRHHIPHRLDDGYGVKAEVLEKAFRDGVSLVVTVDCGIRDWEAAARARELGLDLIVTDHHLPGDRLPDAYAVLDPHQVGDSYPDKDLAGVGVAFKVAQALFEAAGRGHVVHHFLKVAAIGTVADLVPLRGENRVIAKLGLRGLAEPYNLGLQALLNGSGVNGEVDHVDVGWRIAPRINAFTRMGGGQEIVDLFTAKDPKVVEAIMAEMNRRNEERRAEEQVILAAVASLERRAPALFERRVIVVGGKDWHRGVLGNVAARLAQRYQRPALVFSLGEGEAQGSGRSLPGVHLLELVERVADAFERFGGHAQAVGCTLKAEWSDAAGLERLGVRLHELMEDLGAAGRRRPIRTVDAAASLDFWSLDKLEWLERLAPFGEGNPVPLFMTRALETDEEPIVLAGKHLKWQLRRAGDELEAIWWGGVARMNGGPRRGPMDWLYTVRRDRFQGREKILWTIEDARW